MTAQKTLLNPKSLDFPLGDGKYQRTTQKLLQVMQTHEVKPDRRLIKMTEVEEVQDTVRIH